MTPTSWGVNYRALNDLFHLTQSRVHVFRYEIGVQMLEIYNEQVRDLLVTDGSHKKYPSCNFFEINCFLVTIWFLVVAFRHLYMGSSRRKLRWILHCFP
jgi:hypothetical protein